LVSAPSMIKAEAQFALPRRFKRVRAFSSEVGTGSR
jgi:hypothetical protein